MNVLDCGVCGDSRMGEQQKRRRVGGCCGTKVASRRRGHTQHAWVGLSTGTWRLQNRGRCSSCVSRGAHGCPSTVAVGSRVLRRGSGWPGTVHCGAGVSQLPSMSEALGDDAAPDKFDIVMPPDDVSFTTLRSTGMWFYDFTRYLPKLASTSSRQTMMCRPGRTGKMLILSAFALPR